MTCPLGAVLVMLRAWISNYGVSQTYTQYYVDKRECVECLMWKTCTVRQKGRRGVWHECWWTVWKDWSDGRKRQLEPGEDEWVLLHEYNISLHLPSVHEVRNSKLKLNYFHAVLLLMSRLMWSHGCRTAVKYVKCCPGHRTTVEDVGEQRTRGKDVWRAGIIWRRQQQTELEGDNSVSAEWSVTCSTGTKKSLLMFFFIIIFCLVFIVAAVQNWVFSPSLCDVISAGKMSRDFSGGADLCPAGYDSAAQRFLRTGDRACHISWDSLVYVAQCPCCQICR